MAELYFVYSGHGGNEDEAVVDKKTPPRKPQRVRAQMAGFKSTIRQVPKHAISEEGEWHLQTGYCRVPRPRSLAVDGRQPVVRGMPVIDDEDAKAIVKAIMAMRGADKKKPKESMTEGELRLAAKKIPLQGGIQTWRKECSAGGRWTTSNGTRLQRTSPLTVMICPACLEYHCTST